MGKRMVLAVGVTFALMTQFVSATGAESVERYDVVKSDIIMDEQVYKKMEDFCAEEKEKELEILKQNTYSDRFIVKYKKDYLNHNRRLETIAADIYEEIQSEKFYIKTITKGLISIFRET